MGLLGDIFSAGNTAKRRLRGLLDDPIGSMQQAVDNAFPTRYEAQNAISQLRGQQYNPDALQAYNTKLDSAAMNFAPMGITVWHGSPHKFNKFDMSKIGTGEGAQAYGHGLYFSEAPEVAKSYQQVLGGTEKQFYLGGKQVDPRMMDAYESNALSHLAYGKTPKQAMDDLESQGVGKQALAKMQKILDDFYKQGVKEVEIPKANSSLYKVDIPDEAVARMLDWDKPLSQQAPEVQAALGKLGQSIDDGVSIYQVPGGKWIADNGKQMMTFSSESAAKAAFQGRTGKDIWNNLPSTIPADKSSKLRDSGILGIRYLDGGSRSAGQGSSNYVLFSDDLPRILEINGKPTGQVPWAPNEWRGLLGGQ